MYKKIVIGAGLAGAAVIAGTLVYRIREIKRNGGFIEVSETNEDGVVKKRTWTFKGKNREA